MSNSEGRLSPESTVTISLSEYTQLVADSCLLSRFTSAIVNLIHSSRNYGTSISIDVDCLNSILTTFDQEAVKPANKEGV